MRDMGAKHVDDLTKMGGHQDQAMSVEVFERGFKIAKRGLVHRSPPIEGIAWMVR